MREYETVVVLEASLDDSKVDTEIDNVGKIISDGGGEVLDVQRWGRRRLAYEINKKREGIYTLVRYRSEPPVVRELDRRFALNDALLRHLTVISRGPSEIPGSDDRDHRDRDHRDRDHRDRDHRDRDHRDRDHRDRRDRDRDAPRGGGARDARPASKPEGETPAAAPAATDATPAATDATPAATDATPAATDAAPATPAATEAAPATPAAGDAAPAAPAAPSTGDATPPAESASAPASGGETETPRAPDSESAGS